MNDTDTDTAAVTAREIEAAFAGRWGVWLSDTGRWWGTRTRTLTGEEVNAGCVPFVQAESSSELTTRLREQDELVSAHDPRANHLHHRPSSGVAANEDMTLDDVRRIYATRWEVAPITGGYRAVSRGTGGHTPIPRYGRTPGELAESIREIERHA